MKNKSIKILAIESSCDETAAAIIHVVQSTKHIAIESNVILSQVKLHAKYGGVYPELASREHIRNILPVIKEAICFKTQNPNVKFQNYFDVIAVTSGPGLIGSLLVGVNTAKTMAYTLNKPIYSINHLEGHIYSCFAGDKKPEFPILALIVSGGHTSLILMKDHFNYRIIGETLDDAVGESFDKVAKMMNLGYPGGPAVSALAEKFSISNSQFSNKSQKLNKNFKLKIENSIHFPRPMIDSKDFNFSFSGIKTSVLYTLKKFPKKLSKQIQSDICKEFQDAVVETLVSKTLRAAEKYKVKSILLCGGVSANHNLRDKFESVMRCHPECNEGSRFFANAQNNKIKLFCPAKNLSTDNAAMIGIAAAYRVALGKKPDKWYNVNADSNLELGK